MSQPFTFPPPPPPPPPKPAQNGTPASFQARGGHRGRGNPNLRGRGRGQYLGGSESRGGYGSNSNGLNCSHDGQQYDQSQRTDSRGSYNQRARSYTGQKREHSTAFHTKSDDTFRRSRPLAPPAVPSFGVNFDALLAKKPGTTATKAAESAAARGNALGLTPQTNGHESAEDDVDEEAALARKNVSNGALEFEYQGQTSVLKSSEEIAAWIAERRKKWPTQEKREIAAKEAEEKHRKWQEEKQARAKASQAAAKARQEEFLKQKAEREKSRVRQKLLQEQVKKAKEKATVKVSRTDAEAKAERLRRKAEKIAKQLEVAEQALQPRKRRSDNVDDIDALVDQVDQAAASQQEITTDDDEDVSSLASSEDDPEDTSTSGSSGSDTDMESASEPEQSSTRRAGPERVLAPPRKTAPGASSDTRQPCQKFVKTGQCKYGRKCRFRHDKADRKAAQQKEYGIGNRRKGLYQLLVDKEAEEEKRQALRAIIAMGDAGMLDGTGEMHAMS